MNTDKDVAHHSIEDVYTALGRSKDTALNWYKHHAREEREDTAFWLVACLALTIEVLLQNPDSRIGDETGEA